MKGKNKKLRLSKVIEYRMYEGARNKSKAEGIQAELKTPEFMNVNHFGIGAVRKNNSDFTIPNFLSKSDNTENVKLVKEVPMTQAHIDIITERITAMTKGEKVVVAEALPVDICIDRIKNEYEKNQEFVNSIKKAFSIIGVNM